MRLRRAARILARRHTPYWHQHVSACVHVHPPFRTRWCARSRATPPVRRVADARRWLPLVCSHTIALWRTRLEVHNRACSGRNQTARQPDSQTRGEEYRWMRSINGTLPPMPTPCNDSSPSPAYTPNPCPPPPSARRRLPLALLRRRVKVVWHTRSRVAALVPASRQRRGRRLRRYTRRRGGRRRGGRSGGCRGRDGAGHTRRRGYRCGSDRSSRRGCR